MFVIPVSTVGLVLTNPAHQLVRTDHQQVITGEVVTLVQEYGPWFWVTLFYNYVLIAAGGVLFIRLVIASEYLYIDQATLLVVGIAVAVIGNVLRYLTQFRSRDST